MKTNQTKLTLRIKTSPIDANKSGDIFGGWLMSQIDIAGAIAASRRAKGPVVTRSVKELNFLKPIFIHDLVSFYTEIVAVGNSSLTVKVEVFAGRYNEEGSDLTGIKVSDAILVYVAVSKPGEKRLIPKA
jgi:acyl-CoA thioesterase YciA